MVSGARPGNLLRCGGPAASLQRSPRVCIAAKWHWAGQCTAVGACELGPNNSVCMIRCGLHQVVTRLNEYVLAHSRCSSVALQQISLAGLRVQCGLECCSNSGLYPQQCTVCAALRLLAICSFSTLVWHDLGAPVFATAVGRCAWARCVRPGLMPEYVVWLCCH